MPFDPRTSPSPSAHPLDYRHNHSLLAQRRRRSATMWVRIFAAMLLLLAAADVVRVAGRVVIARREAPLYVTAYSLPLLLHAGVWGVLGCIVIGASAAIRRASRGILRLGIAGGLFLELLLVAYTTAKAVHLMQFGLRRSVHLLQVLLGQLSLLLAAIAILAVALQQLISLYRFESPPEDTASAKIV